MAHTPLPAPTTQQFDMSKQKIENPLNITPQYSNFSFIATTDWDIRFVFSELIPQPPPAGPRVELRGNIVMTPVQAKAFAAGLQTTIAQYEASHGTIQWPPKNPSQLH